MTGPNRHRRPSCIAILAVVVSAWGGSEARAQQAGPWSGGPAGMSDLMFRSAPNAGAGFQRPQAALPGAWQVATRFLDQRLAGSDLPLQASTISGLYNRDRFWRLGGCASFERLAPAMTIAQLRLTALKWVPLSTTHWLSAGLSLGVVHLQFDPVDGVWESQYLLNPLNPTSVPSGEVSWTDFQRTAPDLSGHLGLSASGKGQIHYSFRHLPFDIGLLYGTPNRKNFHHQLVLRRSGKWSASTLFVDWTAELHWQRQFGGQSLSLNAWAEMAFRPASVYTGLERPPRAIIGLQTQVHGILTPLIGGIWKDQTRLFLTRTLDLRPIGGTSAWGIGLATQL